MALLSIIVPVYNKVDFIDNCMHSILNQSFKDYEIILINDGSTDGSKEKCNFYKSLDNRVRVIHQVNRGVSTARNVGVSTCSGEYVGFIDSDDIIEFDMYETLISLVNKFGADIAICGIKESSCLKNSSVSNERIEVEVYGKEDGLQQILNGRFNSSANNKIFHKSIAKEILFEGSINEDLYYNFLAFSLSKVSVFYNIPKYYYIKRDNSVSIQKFNNKYFEALHVSRKILNIIEENAPNLIEDARAFDFLKNISLFNLVLLSKENLYEDEFNNIKETLWGYNKFIKSSTKVSTKHKLAYLLLRRSIKLYSIFIKFYCLLFETELSRRTKSLSV